MNKQSATMAERLQAAFSALETKALEDHARVVGLQRLSGGANMETWSFDLEISGGTEPLILRRLPGGGSVAGDAEAGISLASEAALVEVVRAHGVLAPRVRLILGQEHGLGQGYVMSRERGEALPMRLLSDDRYGKALQGLAYQCGQALGQTHRIPLHALPQDLPDYCGERLFQHDQALLDKFGNGSPALQLGLNWLRDNPRPDPGRALVHGDFRNGNLLVDEEGLVAVLDWELAHLGDPLQDLGYITANVWRFGAPGPVGGFGEYADLLEGYHSITGQMPAMEDIKYWQVHAALSWGCVCLLMLDMYRSGVDHSLERAAVGRRLSEAEIDLLVLLEGELS
jgi:aminoglycoside phosphotransferase (APT) family kinase protein